MGVTNFYKIRILNSESEFDKKMVIEYAPEIKLNSLKGEKIAIDASLEIYSSILAMESVDALTDNDGNTTAHINTILQKTLKYFKAGISPIFIFDSPKPNEMKKLELEKRNKRRLKADKGKQGEKIRFKMNSSHIDDIKKLLNLLGCSFIQSPEGFEAEQIGAALTDGDQNDRFCKYMASRDSDVLMFGGNLLFEQKVKSASGKSSRKVLKVFDLEDLLTELDRTYDQLVMAAACLGNDFSDKIQGIGPATVMNKVKTKLDFTKEQLNAMKYFKSEVDLRQLTIEESEYNRDELIEYLIGKKFNKSRVEKMLPIEFE